MAEGKRFRWADHIDELWECVRAGMTDEAIARSGRFPGRSTAAIRMARVNHNIPAGAEFRDHWHTKHTRRVVSETPERIVMSAHDTTDDEQAVWDSAISKTRRARERMQNEALTFVRIMSDKPVAISISSDWHVASTGACDLDGLLAYAQAVQQTPGAWNVVVGDLLDNPIKWSRNTEEVPDAIVALRRIIGTFGAKLLGMTSGNHDDWSVALAGVDVLQWLAERERIHYAPDELVYIVELVEPGTETVTARYCIATRHKYYRHSNLNPSHACFRWLEDRTGGWPVLEDGGEMVPDVLAIGHNHIAVVEERTRGNKPIWGARMGAWHRSRHSRAGGWPYSPPTAPTFILYPHRAKPILGLADYRQALAVLTSERERLRT